MSARREAVQLHGDAQTDHAAPLSEQSKRAPASATKAKLAAVDAVGPLGPDVIVVSGASVSLVQVARAGNASTLPASSIARTSKACAPSGSPV